MTGMRREHSSGRSRPRYNSRAMNERPPRSPRAESREIAELKQLKIDHPELARRSRHAARAGGHAAPHPGARAAALDPAGAGVAGRAAAHGPSGRALRRHSARLDRLPSLAAADGRPSSTGSKPSTAPSTSTSSCSRATATRLQSLVTAWYAATSGVNGVKGARQVDEATPNLDQLLVLSIRPFLARCAEVLGQRIDVAAWHHGHCPFCGWEPDFAVITPSADRRLICGRCSAQWAFPALACPFCANDDRARITSFATRDGRYRVSACDVCKRYLKAYDGRNVTRPVMRGRRQHRHAAARRGGDAARLRIGLEAIPAG